MSKTTAAIKDQLGTNPETTFLLNADYFETMGIEEGSTKISKKTIGHSWICGSPTNGLVGANTATADGQQQTVGGQNRVETLQRIVNPNNTFHEHFRDTEYQDSPTTANWDLDAGRLAMHTSNNHSTMYNTVATFKEIFYNEQTVLKARVIAKEVKWNPNDKIAYFLSANGGGDWEEVTRNAIHTFTATGQDLRAKIVFMGSGGSETYIEDFSVNYTV